MNDSSIGGRSKGRFKSRASNKAKTCHFYKLKGISRKIVGSARECKGRRILRILHPVMRVTSMIVTMVVLWL